MISRPRGASTKVVRNSSWLAEKVGGAMSQCARGCAIFEVDLDFAIIDFAGFGLVSKWITDLRTRAKPHRCAKV